MKAKQSNLHDNAELSGMKIPKCVETIEAEPKAKAMVIT